MIQRLIHEIFSKLKNFYVLIGIIFLLWLTFFDTNDLITQTKLSLKQKELQNTKAFYETKIEEVKADREGLLKNDQLLEKVAREKYFLKKESEDVFVVVTEEE